MQSQYYLHFYISHIFTFLIQCSYLVQSSSHLAVFVSSTADRQFPVLGKSPQVIPCLVYVFHFLLHCSSWLPTFLDPAYVQRTAVCVSQPSPPSFSYFLGKCHLTSTGIRHPCLSLFHMVCDHLAFKILRKHISTLDFLSLFFHVSAPYNNTTRTLL